MSRFTCHCGSRLDLLETDVEVRPKADLLIVPAECPDCGSQYSVKASLLVIDHVLSDPDAEVVDYDLSDLGAKAKHENELIDSGRD